MKQITEKAIELIEERINEIESNKYLRVKLRSNVQELERTIDLLRSLASEEEEMIKKLFADGQNSVFNQKEDEVL